MKDIDDKLNQINKLMDAIMDLQQDEEVFDATNYQNQITTCEQNCKVQNQNVDDLRSKFEGMYENAEEVSVHDAAKEKRIRAAGIKMNGTQEKRKQQQEQSKMAEWLGFNTNDHKQGSDVQQPLLAQIYQDKNEQRQKDLRDIAMMDHMDFQADTDIKTYDHLIELGQSIRENEKIINSELMNQQEVVDKVAGRMDEIVDNLEHADDQLRIATKYQQKGIKSNVGIACILLIILSCLCSSMFMGSGSSDKPEWVKKYEADKEKEKLDQEKKKEEAEKKKEEKEDQKEEKSEKTDKAEDESQKKLLFLY